MQPNSNSVQESQMQNQTYAYNNENLSEFWLFSVKLVNTKTNLCNITLMQVDETQNNEGKQLEHTKSS